MVAMKVLGEAPEQFFPPQSPSLLTLLQGSLLSKGEDHLEPSGGGEEFRVKVQRWEQDGMLGPPGREPQDSCSQMGKGIRGRIPNFQAARSGGSWLSVQDDAGARKQETPNPQQWAGDRA